MREIETYIGLAKARHGLKSDRALDIALGFIATPTHLWKHRKAWPSEASMIRLAELAGIEAEEALCDLGLWKAKSEPVRAAWERLREKAAATTLLALVAVLGFPSPSWGANGEQAALKNVRNNHYAIRRDRIRRLIALFFPIKSIVY